MLPLDQIDVKELYEAVKQLNKFPLLKKKVPVVGKKELVVKRFEEAVLSIPQADAQNIPEFATNFYNKLFADEVDETREQPEGEAKDPNVLLAEQKERERKEEEEMTKKKTEAEKKANAAKKTTTAVKKDVPKKKEEPKKVAKKEVPKKVKKEKVMGLSCFGHQVGSQSAKIDELLNSGKWMTPNDLMKASGRNLRGVKGHIKHLIETKRAVIECKDGNYRVKK
jgi:hypothetical protein